jgi:hypothetical protein
MAEMSMNKAIHGAFRRDLKRFVDALDRFPAGNQTRAAQLTAAWDNFEDQLTHHHTGEHEIAWPHMRAMGFSDDVLSTMDSEHDAMAADLAAARAAMKTLARSASADDAKAARQAVLTLQTSTNTHLEHEEAEFESFYLENRDAPEMKAMGKEFSKVSPSRGGRFFAWVTDGASPDEQEAVTGNVPGPVLAIIGGIWGRGYRKNIAPIWRS